LLQLTDTHGIDSIPQFTWLFLKGAIKFGYNTVRFTFKDSEKIDFSMLFFTGKKFSLKLKGKKNSRKLSSTCQPVVPKDSWNDLLTQATKLLKSAGIFFSKKNSTCFARSSEEFLILFEGSAGPWPESFCKETHDRKQATTEYKQQLCRRASHMSEQRRGLGDACVLAVHPD